MILLIVILWNNCLWTSIFCYPDSWYTYLDIGWIITGFVRRPKYKQFYNFLPRTRTWVGGCSRRTSVYIAYDTTTYSVCYYIQSLEEGDGAACITLRLQIGLGKKKHKEKPFASFYISSTSCLSTMYSFSCYDLIDQVCQLNGLRSIFCAWQKIIHELGHCLRTSSKTSLAWDGLLGFIARDYGGDVLAVSVWATVASFPELCAGRAIAIEAKMNKPTSLTIVMGKRIWIWRRLCNFW